MEEIGIFEEVKNLLIKVIESPNKEYQKRKIIFWYDEKLTYKDYISRLSIDNTVILINENNSFYIRYYLTYQELDKNIVIYCPFTRKFEVKNDLLDIETFNKNNIFSMHKRFPH